MDLLGLGNCFTLLCPGAAPPRRQLGRGRRITILISLAYAGLNIFYNGSQTSLYKPSYCPGECVFCFFLGHIMPWPSLSSVD